MIFSKKHKDQNDRNGKIYRFVKLRATAKNRRLKSSSGIPVVLTMFKSDSAEDCRTVQARIEQIYSCKETSMIDPEEVRMAREFVEQNPPVDDTANTFRFFWDSSWSNLLRCPGRENFRSDDYFWHLKNWTKSYYKCAICGALSMINFSGIVLVIFWWKENYEILGI